MIFHLEIWNEIGSYIIYLTEHVLLFSISILAIWIMIKITNAFFPNKPNSIKILAYISEITIIFHFVTLNIQ